MQVIFNIRELPCRQGKEGPSGPVIKTLHAKMKGHVGHL